MEPEKQETFTIDFLMNGEDTSVQIVGTHSTVMLIFEQIKGNKSIWLENEYGTHPISVVITD
jgi:hypothetical protein